MKLLNTRSITLLIAFTLITPLMISCTPTQDKTSEIRTPANKTGLSEQYKADYAKALKEIGEKNYTKAIAELSRILKNNPGYTEGWGNLALAQLKSGQIKEAKQSATNAIKQDQKSAPLENLLGLIEVEAGAYKSAESHYLRALEINPNFANAHYNLALLNDIYYQKLPIAIQHYERYLALINGTDPDTEAWVEELRRNLK